MKLSVTFLLTGSHFSTYGVQMCKDMYKKETGPDVSDPVSHPKKLT